MGWLGVRERGPQRPRQPIPSTSPRPPPPSSPSAPVPPTHDVALVLGSGWGQTADLIGPTLATVDNADVPGFHAAAVAGHSGSMRSVAIGDTGRARAGLRDADPLLRGAGRPRPWCTRSAPPSAAGCSTIVLTNGCGGLNPAWGPGTPVLISDHINLTAASPLEGPTFVDLTDLYSARLRAIAHEVDPTLDEGVYVQFRGPHYETPAEVQMAKRHRRRPRRHVDGARRDRRPSRRPGGPRDLPGDQPGRRHLRPAAVPPGGHRGRPGRRRAVRPAARRRRAAGGV